MRTLKKVLVATLLIAVVSVTAVAASAPKNAKLAIKGSTVFKINQYEKDSVHWVPGTIVIGSGGTLTISNKSRDNDPHTFSIVSKAQLPRTVGQFENCTVCDEIAHAHGVNPAEPPHGPPPNLTVDPGNDGFNQPGDSQFIGPHQTVTVKITAPKGTKLYFMCAVHPWMQGIVKVK